MTSFPHTYNRSPHHRLRTILQRAEAVVGMTMSFDDIDLEIPEPDPIRPGGEIEVVPYLPPLYGADLEKLKPINVLFNESFEPLPAEPSYDIHTESFGNIFLCDCLLNRDEEKSDTETVSTATDSVSLNSSSHSLQSTMGDSFFTSLSIKQEADPSRQNFQDKQWEEKFRELLRFQKKHGHFNVPHGHSNHKLAQWIKRMRYQYQLRKKGCHSTLTDERFRKLNDIGFVWESHTSSWISHYEALKEFNARAGHSNVPNSNKSLSAWCKHQRREYRKYIKGSRTRITPARIVALESLGFNWDPRGLC
ncbi:helicase domain protein [Nitzschia inconspicua]|uniref:Helicase domain protein n=1 Tax=Nitzschia inconspicua TaxID=303405 RepID=A0A9K3KG03_9STRA|nr:helicase domain protein [Nitzschia inconspicua]